MKRTRKQEREYWLLSRSEQARFSRARNEVPMEEVFDATDEEAKELCAGIRKWLAKGDFCEIWVKVLVYFRDTEAIDVLESCLQRYKERQPEAKRIGGDFSPWIAMLKDAIKKLKKAAKEADA